MTLKATPPLVNLALTDWTADRVAATLALAAPNDRRIAQAALDLLALDDHVAAHAAWSDAQGATNPGTAP
jgi:hypothetical protein